MSKFRESESNRREGDWNNLFQNTTNFLVCERIPKKDRKYARSLLECQSEEFVLDLYSSSQLLLTVSCYICKLLMIDSSALHCGHVFCNFCIRSYLSVDKHCPRCGIWCRCVTIDTIYEVDSTIEAVYPQLLNTFLRDEVDPEEVQAPMIFSSKDAAREAVESKAMYFPFYSFRYRRLLQKERRKQDFPDMNVGGNSILHSIMEMSMDSEGTPFMRTLCRGAITVIVSILLTVLVDSMIGEDEGYDGFLFYVATFCGAVLLTYVMKLFYGEVLNYRALMDPVSSLVIRRQGDEQEETLMPMSWKDIHDLIIDAVGPWKVYNLCEEVKDPELMSGAEADEENDGCEDQWDDAEDNFLRTDSPALLELTQGHSILEAI